GYDTIDVAAASQRGIYVTNCPGKNATAVAELAWALILALDRRIPDNVAQLRAGQWNKKEYSKARGLCGRTLGLVGLGRIGQLMIPRARAFGMPVVAWSRSLTPEKAEELGVERKASPEEVAAAADVVSVHVALKPDTKQLCGQKFFAALRPGAYFINTARGGVVDEKALEKVIQEKGIRAGLDVFAQEPATATGAFADGIAKLPQVYGTHHIGASTDQAQEAITDETVRILDTYRTSGQVLNAVNLCHRSPATHLLTVRHRDRVGVLLGNGIGGLEESQKAVRTVDSRGGMRLDPFFFPKMLPNMAAAHIALNFGARGYNNTVITACAAGTQAIGDAMDLVRAGRVDVCITGGSEASLCELGLCGFAVIRSLSQNNDEPQKASRPFDAERDGFVAAEGAGIMILESEEHAKSRNAPILAEVAGYGACNDAFHVVAPSADGDGAMRAMREALADAQVETAEVDYINAHGTSTQLNDKSETLAIKTLFGEDAYRVPISATKSMVGHSFGAAGAVESVAAVQTIVNGVIHPTINLEHPDPECDLDYVPEGAREADVDVVLKNSFGFGGQNACLVFKRYEG
ncbi:MAG: beta-ketoacyl-ACP synthase II, partial [Chloroflexi bacterium]|nr:beta-ketoacyl-ACP synthase II [Chloroflexota bacterium]